MEIVWCAFRAAVTGLPLVATLEVLRTNIWRTHAVFPLATLAPPVACCTICAVWEAF